ncbi:uncharacterized protein ACOB8E_006586 [Sarcophilus harrisii]
MGITQETMEKDMVGAAMCWRQLKTRVKISMNMTWKKHKGWIEEEKDANRETNEEALAVITDVVKIFHHESLGVVLHHCTAKKRCYELERDMVSSLLVCAFILSHLVALLP